MAVTDQEVLDELQGHLLETQNSGASFSSGLWTVTEVVDALNQRQRRLLRDTMMLLKRADLVTTPNVTRQPLPTDCIAVQRIAWRGSDGVRREVPRSDGHDADNAILDWELEMGDRPRVYMDAEVPQLQIQTAPAPANAGVLEALYVYLGALLSNTGVALTVPDEWAPAVKWGAVADLLSKVGRGQDLKRAAEAELRYQEAVAATAIMLAGFSE